MILLILLLESIHTNVNGFHSNVNFFKMNSIQLVKLSKYRLSSKYKLKSSTIQMPENGDKKIKKIDRPKSTKLLIFLLSSIRT